MKLRSFRFEVDASGYGSRIWIDGVLIENCQRVMIDVSVDRPPRVTLQLISLGHLVTGKAEVAEVIVPIGNGRPSTEVPPACDGDEEKNPADHDLICPDCGHCLKPGEQCVCYAR
jgi:hypothetical protein